MVAASTLFNNFRHSYFWILDGEYVVKRLHNEWRFLNSLDFANRLKIAREILEGMLKEEAEKLRSCTMSEWEH